jgi:VanZ family protein
LKNQVRFFLPAAGWLVVSTVLLTLPGSAFPQENWLDKIWFDKWVHVAMFGLITFLLCWGIYKKKKETNRKLYTYFIVAAAFCLLYGIAMEFVQKFWVPNRSFDAGDIVADGIGSAFGGIFSFRRYAKNRPL